MTAEEREAVRVIRDLKIRLREKDRHIAYLRRDKQLALLRARKAEAEANRISRVVRGNEMTAERYIVIPNWDEFQHYKDKTRPAWIKLYPRLLRNDEFLGSLQASAWR